MTIGNRLIPHVHLPTPGFAPRNRIRKSARKPPRAAAKEPGMGSPTHGGIWPERSILATRANRTGSLASPPDHIHAQSREESPNLAMNRATFKPCNGDREPGQIRPLRLRGRVKTWPFGHAAGPGIAPRHRSLWELLIALSGREFGREAWRIPTDGSLRGPRRGRQRFVRGQDGCRRRLSEQRPSGEAVEQGA